MALHPEPKLEPAMVDVITALGNYVHISGVDDPDVETLVLRLNRDIWERRAALRLWAARLIVSDIEGESDRQPVDEAATASHHRLRHTMIAVAGLVLIGGGVLIGAGLVDGSSSQSSDAPPTTEDRAAKARAMWGNALTHLQVISADGQAIGAGASEDKNVFELYRSLESSCRRLQTDVETAQRDTLPPASVGGCGFRRKGALRPRV